MLYCELFNKFFYSISLAYIFAPQVLRFFPFLLSSNLQFGYLHCYQMSTLFNSFFHKYFLNKFQNFLKLFSNYLPNVSILCCAMYYSSIVPISKQMNVASRKTPCASGFKISESPYYSINTVGFVQIGSD